MTINSQSYGLKLQQNFLCPVRVYLYNDRCATRYHSSCDLLIAWLWSFMSRHTNKLCKFCYCSCNTSSDLCSKLNSKQFLIPSCHSLHNTKGRILPVFKWHNQIPKLKVILPWSNWEYFYSLLDRMLVHSRVTPTLNFLVPIYTAGWREALW